MSFLTAFLLTGAVALALVGAALLVNRRGQQG
jgi:hypothetical protein